MNKNKQMKWMAEAERVPLSDRRTNVRGRRTGRASDRTNLMSGQALVMLLFFIMIGITITTTAIFIVLGNSLSAGDVEQGEVARQMAETGAENALLQVLRGNLANETITLPDGNIVVTITNGANITIDSVATAGNYVKKVRVTATKDGKMDVTSWKEVVN